MLQQPSKLRSLPPSYRKRTEWSAPDCHRFQYLPCRILLPVRRMPFAIHDRPLRRDPMVQSTATDLLSLLPEHPHINRIAKLAIILMTEMLYIRFLTLAKSRRDRPCNPRLV